jgi:hypothetical protein
MAVSVVHRLSGALYLKDKESATSIIIFRQGVPPARHHHPCAISTIRSAPTTRPTLATLVRAG